VNIRTCLAAFLAAAWLMTSACQPITREKPEWFILETYQEAIADYQTLSAQIVRLGADGKESGQTANVVLARPNRLRMETFDSGKRTDLLVIDGQRVFYTSPSRSHEGKAPARLEDMDIREPSMKLFIDPASVLALEQVESTTETLNGSEVVRVRGFEAATGRPPVQVVIWISPDSGFPVRYKRTDGNRTFLCEFRNLVVDGGLAPGVFTP